MKERHKSAQLTTILKNILPIPEAPALNTTTSACKMTTTTTTIIRTTTVAAAAPGTTPSADASNLRRNSSGTSARLGAVTTTGFRTSGAGTISGLRRLCRTSSRHTGEAVMVVFRGGGAFGGTVRHAESVRGEEAGPGEVGREGEVDEDSREEGGACFELRALLYCTFNYY